MKPLNGQRERRVCAGLIAFGWMAATGAGAGAQERPVVWSVAPVTSPVVRGAVMVVHLTARIDDGWHMYSITQGPGGPIRTQITVPTGQPFALADTIGGPVVVKRFDPNFGINVEMYDSRATFAVPVRVLATAAPGPASLALTARFQTCNATLCLPPHTEKLALPITISAATVRAASSHL